MQFSTLATSGNFSMRCFIIQNPSSSLTSRHSFQLIKQNKIKISVTRVAYYLTMLLHFDKCSLF